MAKKLNTTVHVAGVVYRPGQVVPKDVEERLAESWPADRDDLWETVTEPKAAEEKSSPAKGDDEKPKARTTDK